MPDALSTLPKCKCTSRRCKGGHFRWLALPLSYKHFLISYQGNKTTKNAREKREVANKRKVTWEQRQPEKKKRREGRENKEQQREVAKKKSDSGTQKK
jgi:hypothetical protein